MRPPRELTSKELARKLEFIQNTRNSCAKHIGVMKTRGDDIQPMLDAVGLLGELMRDRQAEFKRKQ